MYYSIPNIPMLSLGVVWRCWYGWFHVKLSVRGQCTWSAVAEVRSPWKLQCPYLLCSYSSYSFHQKLFSIPSESPNPLAIFIGILSSAYSVASFVCICSFTLESLGASVVCIICFPLFSYVVSFNPRVMVGHCGMLLEVIIWSTKFIDIQPCSWHW